MATAYASMPKAWSNKRQVERLRADAYESLTRMLNRAVADTGTNFSIWSALRTHADQVALFKANYTKVNRGRKYSTDRAYSGSIWARKPGGVSVASPDLGSNHQDGLAVDIHPGKIQTWIQRNGLLYGWSWDEGKRVGESWHFRYIPSRDQMKHEGPLDHAAIQKAVGATVDGKIGTGTVAKIKAWQKKHGLTADGKVGAKTKAAMLGKAVADTAEDATDAKLKPAESLKIQEAGPAKNAYDDRKGHQIKHATIHWWGRPSGQTFAGIRDYLIDNTRQVSAHYVVSGEQVARILPESRGAWGNGNRRANLEGIVIECDPNLVVETLPTLAALLGNIFSRHGVLPVYPHNHWTSTECPGDYEPYIPAVVEAATTGKPVKITQPTPSTGGKLPEGKELLMKLTDVPDFPLLRTPGHLCYYGDASGPIESVSGKSPNSLNPGEIYGSGKSSGAHGLKQWQAEAGIEADGRFGNGTEAKVREIQKRAGLKVDSKLGPSTWYALFLLGG